VTIVKTELQTNELSAKMFEISYSPPTTVTVYIWNNTAVQPGAYQWRAEGGTRVARCVL